MLRGWLAYDDMVGDKRLCLLARYSLSGKRVDLVLWAYDIFGSTVEVNDVN